MILLTVPAYRPRLGRFDELPAPGTCRGCTRLHGHRVTNGPCCHGQMQMPRSETELPHALPSHTCRERCCIGHRERMGLDSPITIRGRPLLESSGHRAGGAAGHQHGWSNKGVPHRLRPGGPLHRLSYRPGSQLEEILRTIASSSRRPVGATGAVGVHAAQACSYCRTVPSAEIPCCPRCRHLQVSGWLSS